MNELIQQFRNSKKKFRDLKKEIFESQKIIDICKDEIKIEQILIRKTKRILVFLRQKIKRVQKQSNRDYFKDICRKYLEQIQDHRKNIQENQEEIDMETQDITENQINADTVFGEMQNMVNQNPEIASFVNTSFLHIQPHLETAAQLLG
jgi:hypothetical protein